MEIFCWNESDEVLTEEELQALSHKIGYMLFYTLELTNKSGNRSVHTFHQKLKYNLKKIPVE